MGRLRVVVLHAHADAEIRFMENLDFNEIEDALRRDTVVGLYIGKE